MSVGYDCARTAQQTCSDCGSALCDAHSESCGLCQFVFCPGCLFYHHKAHAKPTGGADHGEGKRRKSA